jgi:hypothetical protein
MPYAASQAVNRLVSIAVNPIALKQNNLKRNFEFCSSRIPHHRFRWIFITQPTLLQAGNR